MDWVETTGKSVEEATDRALAHLGVHRDDAEVEVLEEPKTGLFGRVRGEARVRARVRPASPRPKRSRRSGSREGSAEKDRPSGKSKSSGKSKDPKKSVAKNEEKTHSDESEVQVPVTQAKSSGKKERSNKNKDSHSSVGSTVKSESKEQKMSDGIPLAEQGEIARKFLDGFVESLGIEATSNVNILDEETVEISLDATPPNQLGILVGPRGVTLQALQEITRTFVQSKSEGRTDRILVDVAKYRERRVAALARFASQVAVEVLETGEERALEPMSPADRKAVHDSLSGRDDVTTRSEGEEPRRFVVISPA